MKKSTFLLGLSLFLTLGLAACGGTDADYTPEADEPVVAEPAPIEEDDAEEAVDALVYATSRGGITTASDLIDALAAEGEGRAWVAGLGADVTVEGPLYIVGQAERHSGAEWQGDYNSRKLGFYTRVAEIGEARRVPSGSFDLTVTEGIHVYSDGAFFISDGPFVATVNADVYVNVPYFRLAGVQINGDLIFSSQEYLDTAIAQVWDSSIATIQDGGDDYETDLVLYNSNTGFQVGGPSSADPTANVSNAELSDLVLGEIRVGDEVIDAVSHATSRGGIVDADALADALSSESRTRAWVAGLAADVTVDGPLYIEGNVRRHSAGEWQDVYARKLGFYAREAELNGARRVPSGSFDLTVTDGIFVNSPGAFFISDGPFVATVNADVHVNVPYFRLSGVQINGDLIFASQEYLDSAIAQVWDSSIATIQEGEDADYATDLVLYNSNTGFQEGGLSSDPAANVSNTDLASLVTGTIRVAE